MSRRTKGAHLYFRKRKRPARKGVWVIVDGNKQISSGCRKNERQQAEEALGQYLAEKYQPSFATDPARVLVADVLNLYASERATELAHPELVAYHMMPLLDFFGDRDCDWISGFTCRGYVKARTTGILGSRKVMPGTARRELETLSAALNYSYKEKKLKFPIPVTFPKKAPSRQRWLTRSEGAALLAGALGFAVVAFDIHTREPMLWRRVAKPRYYLARFILIGLYTGTRRRAITQLRWQANTSAGWFDLDRGVLYRKGHGEVQTNKRRTPAPIADRLLPHLRRWRRMTFVGPIEYEGELLKGQRRSWRSARVRAGLDDSVTPHVMRHTCATWLLQKGVPTWEVAGYLGTSEKVIRDHYGHHAPDFLQRAKRAFSRPRV